MMIPFIYIYMHYYYLCNFILIIYLGKFFSFLYIKLYDEKMMRGNNIIIISINKRDIFL
jgi:hypothetical protein